MVTNKLNVDIDKLTDEDILAMPQDCYMNEIQLAYFRKKLLAQELEILDNAKRTTDALQEQETNYIADDLDRATIEEEHIIELRSRDRERKMLQKIHYTLQLIADKEYGYCEDTGEMIGLKRLLARPTANLTIEAQEKRERMQKHFAELT